ncbi:unnamed protein product [Microthlaspi erraticum]|uniref:Uncharacterized protein n=1 Tax=Microthlaspi erraticum TaxID=1685480 RepID=A0A6D2KKW7_9BRAS|nr:unnamed protein product [Microthlaspi erraticum]
MFLSFHIVAWKCAEYLHPEHLRSCSRCRIDLGRSSHLSICSSDLHSASTKLLRMVSYVVQTLLFLIWRTLIFRRPVDSSHVRTMIVPPGQSCCIFTSARSFLILSCLTRTKLISLEHKGDSLNSKHKRCGIRAPPSPALRRLGALATFSAHACEGSRSSGITQKLDERLHPGTTVHRGTRFILPSIGLTGAPCQCLKRSYSQKSEGCSRRPYRESAPTAQTGWPRNECSALGQTMSVRLKSRPKSKPLGRSRITTRETQPAVGQPQPATPQPRTTKAREPGVTPRGRATPHVPARTLRPTRETMPASGRRFPSANSYPPDHAGRRHNIRPRPFRLGQRPDCPADRPDRPSERRGRPEAVFEAQSAQFKPKAGADLARLGLAVFLYLEHYKYFFLAL